MKVYHDSRKIADVQAILYSIIKDRIEKINTLLEGDNVKDVLHLIMKYNNEMNLAVKWKNYISIWNPKVVSINDDDFDVLARAHYTLPAHFEIRLEG